MRLLRLFLIAILAAFWAFPAAAQSPDSGVYQVTDVPVDITADSAAHARDQAVKQGQRAAFEQLLQRIGADPSVASKLSDDDIAALVQSFEVQNERSSAVRYIGTFTVQFRPSAVRNYLGGHNASFTDTVSRPVLVLPVSLSGGHPILWEESTPWHQAWDNGAHAGGLVPVVVPGGGLDDIALLSTEETMAGKADAIAALINKYQAGSALVAVLDGDLTKPGTPLTVEMQHYDASGTAQGNASVILSVPADKKELDALLPQAVKQVRQQLEADWRQEQGSSAAAASDNDEAPADNGPTAHLPVNVPIATLAEWEQIRQKLDHVPSIHHAEIVTLARGMTNIELEFTGEIPQLQAALAAQNLSLAQSPGGGWLLQPTGGTP